MKKLQLNRRNVFVLLFLVVGFALMLTGLARGPVNEATAATGSPFPSITAGHVLMASKWSPADGDTDVAVDVVVKVLFNYDLAAGAIKDSTFYIQKAGSSAHLSATLSYNSGTHVASLKTQYDLLPGTSYHVTLTSAIKDKGNYALNNAGTWTFTTASAPLIQSVTPADGSTDIPLGQTISVLFTQPMDISTLTANSFYLQKTSGGDKVPASISLSADKKTASLDPSSDLEKTTEYTLTITPNVESLAHIMVTEVNQQFSFTTSAGAPVVTQKTPASAATGVAVTDGVVVIFDQTMNATTITTATFYIQKSGGSPLPATVTYNMATHTATLQPLSSLEAGASYQVTLSDAIKGANGLTLTGAPIVWSFSTTSAAPTVTTKVPAAGATGVSPTQAISATFSTDMDPTTLTSATFYVEKSGGTPLPATVTYAASTRTVTLDPLADLDKGATYEVTLSTAVKGADNQVLAGAPVTWTFSTQSATPAVSFSDVTPGVTPYATAIAALADDGVVTGFQDGTFRPYDYVTRQQFAKMIVLALGLPVTGHEICPFTDVQTQTGTDPFYPSKYVAVCVEAGITTGKTATTFAPTDVITHQQLITMVVRAADLTSPPAAYTPPFGPGQFSPTLHYLNARKAAYVGLLDGLIGVGQTYNFFGGSTRGECAQLLFNLMTLMAQ